MKQFTKEYYSYISGSRKKSLMMEKDIKTRYYSERTTFLIKENLKHVFVLDNVDATVGLSLMNVTIFLLGGLTNNTINVCISTYLQGLIFILSLICYIIQTNFQKSIIADIFFVLLLFVSCILPFLSIKLNGCFNSIIFFPICIILLFSKYHLRNLFLLELGLILKILILVMAININETNIYIILLLLSSFFFSIIFYRYLYFFSKTISISFTAPKNLMMIFPYINEYQEICLLKLADIIIDTNNYMNIKLNAFCHDIPQINITQQKKNHENLQMNISRIINKFYTLKNQKIFLNFPPYYCLKTLYYKKLNLMALYIEKKKKKIKKLYSQSHNTHLCFLLELSKKMKNCFIYYDLPCNQTPTNLLLNTGSIKESPPAVKEDKPQGDIIKKEYPKKDAVKRKEPKKDAVKKREPKKDAVKRKEPKKDAVKKREPKIDAVKKREPKIDAVKEDKLRRDKQHDEKRYNDKRKENRSRKKEIKRMINIFQNNLFYSKVCSKQLEDNPPKKIIIDNVKKNKIEKKAKINDLFTSTVRDDTESELKEVRKKERTAKRDVQKRESKKRGEQIQRKRKQNYKNYESIFESSVTDNFTHIKPHGLNKIKTPKDQIKKLDLRLVGKYRDTEDEEIKNKLNKTRKKKDRSKNNTNQGVQSELDSKYKNQIHNDTKKHKKNNKKKFIEQRKHGHEINTNLSNQELYKKYSTEKNNVLDKTKHSIYDRYIRKYDDKTNYNILSKFKKSLEHKEKGIKYSFKINKNDNTYKYNELKGNEFIEINKNHKKKTSTNEQKSYSFYSNDDQYISDEKIIFINLSCLFYVLIHKIKQLLKYIEKINLVVQGLDFKQGISPKQNFLLAFIDQKVERYYILWSNMFDLIYHIENYIIHILLILVFTFSSILIRIAPIHLSRSYMLVHHRKERKTENSNNANHISQFISQAA
ncbi:PIR protein CIR protein [Plasmodium vinckei]|uniref:PIR protein CIR protein n=1 Tax=Plasmodium vinckei TaxID=5860 RepID=A0A6V7T735_PLAVN|nr:PIR protein CIR protein [Plasmodium vinckei]